MRKSGVQRVVESGTGLYTGEERRGGELTVAAVVVTSALFHFVLLFPGPSPGPCIPTHLNVPSLLLLIVFVSLECLSLSLSLQPTLLTFVVDGVLRFSSSSSSYWLKWPTKMDSKTPPPETDDARAPCCSDLLSYQTQRQQKRASLSTLSLVFPPSVPSSFAPPTTTPEISSSFSVGQS